MNIDKYTFDEFYSIAANFHGYPAPGIFLGGYMVALAKEHLPEDTLFEALCETNKCLPDAVQLLTLCSTGNGWMKVVNFGRYAVILYDKYTGFGIRVALSTEKMKAWTEMYAWFFKTKAKADQDTKKLLKEIEAAGATICTVEHVQVPHDFFAKQPSVPVGVCPVCQEGYPLPDGALCRGCQGEAWYKVLGTESPTTSAGYTKGHIHCSEMPVKKVAVEEAIGKKALHDMTQIIPGESKGPAFKRGQEISEADVCRLQKMGKNNLYVPDNGANMDDWVHEDVAVQVFAKSIKGEGIYYGDPAEGKIDFYAQERGLLCIDTVKLQRFVSCNGVMLATRHNYSVVDKDKAVAGCRAIPLYLPKDLFERAVQVLGKSPLMFIKPIRKAKAGVLVTGTEVFNGLVKDSFIPIIENKIAQFDGQIICKEIVPDDAVAIAKAVQSFIEQGVDLIVTTGGMSVDPDDTTRVALTQSGMKELAFGIPVLPGAMNLVGKIVTQGTNKQGTNKQGMNKQIDVLGVPACALHYKITGFDLLLPKVLAGIEITPALITDFAEGGMCLQCKSCTFPKCTFGR